MPSIIQKRWRVTIPGGDCNYVMATDELLLALRENPVLYEYGGQLTAPSTVNGMHQTLIVDEFTIAEILEGVGRVDFVKPVKEGPGKLPRPLPGAFARFLTHSARLLAGVPHITAYTPFQLPFRGPGQDFLSFTQPGLNPDAQIFQPASAIIPMELDTAEAHAHFSVWNADIAFQGDGDIVAYLAYAITAYLRLLFNGCSPFFVFRANASRTGKDAMVGQVHDTYMGYTNEISFLGRPEEDEKRLTASILAGAALLHWPNLVGRFRSPLLEKFLTSLYYISRVLHCSRELRVLNHFLSSASGNSDFTLGGDLTARTLYVNLFLDVADPNNRTFTRPDIHRWALANRLMTLGMFKRFLLDWFDAGCPAPTGNFASFPQWFALVAAVAQHATGIPLPLASTSAQADPRIADTGYLLELLCDSNHEDRRLLWSHLKPDEIPGKNNFYTSDLFPLIEAIQDKRPGFLEEFPVNAIEFNQQRAARTRFGLHFNARVGIPTGGYLTTCINPGARSDKLRWKAAPIAGDL